MPGPTPHYQFIAIARTIARGFTEQAAGHPEGEALIEAARAIWDRSAGRDGMAQTAERDPLDEVYATDAIGPATRSRC